MDGMTADLQAEAEAFLNEGDRLRDLHEWKDAAAAYAAFLERRPEEWGIWVQYGHCVKEAGDPRDALLCYREAERLHPGDADLHLQLGHALKLLGRIPEAIEEYARALSLDPSSEAARAEMDAAASQQPVLAPAPGLSVLQAGSPMVPRHSAPQPIVAASIATTPAVTTPAAEGFAPLTPPPSSAPVEIQKDGADSWAPTLREWVLGSKPAAPQPAAAELGAAAGMAASRQGTPGSAALLVFDASDLMDYFKDNRAPTGIQRVQLAVIMEALKAATPEHPVAVCAFEMGGGFWREITPDRFVKLWSLSRSSADATEPTWREAVAEVFQSLRRGVDFPFPMGSTLVNLGTSWWIPNYFLRVREAKARFGVRYVPFVHDCIPLIVPEHCSAGLVDDFARWFSTLCVHADGVLANSECTKRDFIQQMHRILPDLDLPVEVVRLDALTEEVGPQVQGPEVRLLRPGRPYVLFVGTIESRKNHLLVFNAWLTLVRRMGMDAVPDLICVGKSGWLADAALTLYANSPTLQSKVMLLTGISDAALAGLYRNALFTVYNSFYEGWGLPVTESIAHGKVPLVPNHSSLPEAGGDLAVYFEHQSEPDLVEKLQRLITDAAWRSDLESRITSGRHLRSWGDVASGLAASVARMAEHPAPVLAERLRLAAGEVVEFRRLPGPAPLPMMAMADTLRSGGWQPLEDWGVWCDAGVSSITLPGAEQIGGNAALRVQLDMVAPPGKLHPRLRLRWSGDDEAATPFRNVNVEPSENMLCVLDAPPQGTGALVLDIDNGPGIPRPDEGRALGMGVKNVMLCRRDDYESRMAYLERKAFGRCVP